MPRHKQWNEYLFIYLKAVEYFLYAFTTTPELEKIEPFIIPCENYTKKEIHSKVVQFRRFFANHLPQGLDDARLMDPPPPITSYLEKLVDTAQRLEVKEQPSSIMIRIDPLFLTARRLYPNSSGAKVPTLSNSSNPDAPPVKLDLNILVAELRRLEGIK